MIDAQHAATADQPQDETLIENLLLAWASATRTGARDRVLQDFIPDALIYDVLSPLKYDGTDAYRRSWGEWQPETRGEGRFDLQDLKITASDSVAFAHGLILCGGTLADGRTFEDLVRATFCLRKVQGVWCVAHIHISKPV